MSITAEGTIANIINEEDVNIWIDMQRKVTECDEHWSLRKQFLRKNIQNSEKETLLCLAQIFVNIQTLGCRYSREIMEKVKLLAGDIGVEYKQKRRIQRTFVAASDAASSKIQASTGRQSSKEQNMGTNLNQFVRASSSLDVKTSWSLPTNTDKRLLDEPEIRMANKYLKTGHGRAVQLHTSRARQYRPIQFSPTFNLSNDSPLQLLDKEFLKFLSQCVIIFEPKTSFRVTANNFFDKSSIEYQFVDVADDNFTSWSCSLYLLWRGRSTQVLKDCKDTSRSLSIEAAAKSILKSLSEICRIVIRRKNCMGDKNKINLEDISSDKPKDSVFTYKAASDGNIGARMMKMMGWSGGGLGIRNDGIVEPVRAFDSTGAKQGIGFKESVDRKQLKMLLDKYVSSNIFEDLIFSPDISKETRADIHKIIRSNPMLKSVSRNESGHRYLTVKRKVEPNALADYLASEGGEAGDYKLYPPGTLEISNLDVS